MNPVSDGQVNGFWQSRKCVERRKDPVNLGVGKSCKDGWNFRYGGISNRWEVSGKEKGGEDYKVVVGGKIGAVLGLSTKLFCANSRMIGFCTLISPSCKEGSK